jgi:hypothetical protein
VVLVIFHAIGEQLANPPANGKHEPMPPNPAANKRKGNFSKSRFVFNRKSTKCFLKSGEAFEIY